VPALRDRLARLTRVEATELLGPDGATWIDAGARVSIDPRQVYLGDDLFRMTFPSETRGRARAIVTITTDRTSDNRLDFHCTCCLKACEHIGAALAHVLEEKASLGLVEAAKNSTVPVTEAELIAQALSDRRQRAQSERMRIVPQDPDRPWTDYTVTSTISGKQYRVALRGREPGQSYCSCPDFRSNTLGTCKHILKVLTRAERQFGAALNRRFRQSTLDVSLHYGESLELRLLMPGTLDPGIASIVGDLRDQAVHDIPDLLKRIRQLERAGTSVQIYPDAEEFIQQRLYQEQIRDRVHEIRRRAADHPLRKRLLKSELLPYQLDGIAFAVGAGRAILADEMGLGKTIQGIGVAELLAREADISRVLVVCPASLKAQWQAEISRFTDRTTQLISGGTSDRATQYSTDAFFTICNYEQVLRDVEEIERVTWDLIILDEGQRIKNWESKTTRVIKGLRSRFALVLTGTPLENRLDDLYSIVQFIDDRRLGPGFRFFNFHRIVDERGKVIGIRNLTELRENLRPILLRRTRESVRQELPERTYDVVRITPTPEQAEMAALHQRNVSQIVNKPFLTEMDFLMLQKELQACRMAANSTFLVDKQPPGFSTKLERLAELFEELLAEDDRKILVFSEWTTMLDLIEPQLNALGASFVRLDGSVPQKDRPALVETFQTDPACRLFLTTNAGSTGLNLQAANTVVNVDLPWNPAVLEQRIARAYRMGQKRPVDVFVLVTTDTLEERMLTVLSGKSALALAALDLDSDVDEVHLTSGIEELRSRMKSLLGISHDPDEDEPVAPAADASSPAAASSDPVRPAGSGSAGLDAAGPRSTTAAPVASGSVAASPVAQAGGQLFASAVGFLQALLPASADSEPVRQLAHTLQQGLSTCIRRDDSGQAHLMLPLPDTAVLQPLATLVSQWLIGQSQQSAPTEPPAPGQSLVATATAE